ncbi:HlyD family secretion protein [Shewanella gelidimarina]|uniref:HlyD family secretion protein n=1 Tax=Shewanella gelidimarina TaxID=56813 RepID=UPI00200DD608|nr:HlyD family secretion protein [Shewanella gelidimarina]MCL1058516.1 HlyD family secretion protein [Shewanella gelidimarina]
MDLLLVLTYTAICIAIFKIFKIPLTKWTVPTAILGGIFIVGALILLMNYNHPYTPYGKEMFVTTPINPLVRGVVVSVEVEANTPIKKGDVLFKLDPTGYAAIVKQKRAALVAAELEVPQLEASWEMAKAAVVRATADRDRSKSAYARYEKGRKRGGANSPFTELELDNKRQLYLASEAQLTASNAEALRVRLAFESNVDGVNTKVAAIQGELEKAQFDLDQTVVRAPADGIVTQLALRPGIVAVPMPLRSLLSFIPDDDRIFAGSFWQNSLLRLQEGDEAEVILDGAPGVVFKGKVAQILPAMAEGEIQSGGRLITSNIMTVRGRAIVVIELEDQDEVIKRFPAGVSGHIAIYTEHFAHVAIMRKVLLRMQGWLNYLFH